MNDTSAELISVLDQLVSLLESDGDSHWSRWMLSAKTELLDDPQRGVSKLLSAYGGMGSFNDLIVGQRTVEGRFEWKPGYQEMNGRLETLRNKAYDLAIRLKKAGA